MNPPVTPDDRLRRAIAPTRTVPGWATVELDRAERELARGLDVAPPPAIEAPGDALLGAFCRLARLADGAELLLLEPSTEGPLAAALARHGEGWLVTWLVVDRASLDRARGAGFALSAEASGPLGPEHLVLGGPRDGPFVLLVIPGRR